MQQVIFNVPVINFPLSGFGLMLLVAFVLVIAWSRWRTPKVGLSWERFQDMAMLLLLCGLAGARLVYMLQYSDQFDGHSAVGLFLAFFKIWEGGIVFYGSIFGGFLAYLVYRYKVLKRLNVNGWQLADAVAPLLAVGMAVGRIGCYLNGCCWGQVACAECQPMPLPPELGQFPLVPAHARKQVTLPAPQARLPQIHGLQTSTGFTTQPAPEPVTDPRSVVAALEPNTAAARSGLQPGDKVVEVNGKPNGYVLEVGGASKPLAEAQEKAAGAGVTVRVLDADKDDQALLIETADAAAFAEVRAKLTSVRGLTIHARDGLSELARNGPLGVAELALKVERKGDANPVAVTFTPRTVTFFPTQLYETISMVLLTLLLLAYQPFRRHDGQVMVLLMLGYAVHRFLNEAIRIEPTYRFGLTLSQWISVGIFAAGVLIELYLRRTQPELPAGLVPLGYGAKPTPAAASV